MEGNVSAALGYMGILHSRGELRMGRNCRNESLKPEWIPTTRDGMSEFL